MQGEEEALFIVFEEVKDDSPIRSLTRQLSFKEKQQTFAFGRTPLGFTFAIGDDHHPVVTGVASGSEAEKLGVKKGFELVQIDGQEVMNWDYHEVEALLNKWVQSVGARAGILGAKPDDQLYLVFEDKKAALTKQKSFRANQTTLAFTKRPLGFGYRHETPVIVTSVEPGSEAEELGVQLGMKIVQIDHENILAMDFDKVDAILKKASKRLEIDTMSKDEKMWSKLKESQAQGAKIEQFAIAVEARLDSLEASNAEETKKELLLARARTAELEKRLADLEVRYQAEPSGSWFSCCTNRSAAR